MNVQSSSDLNELYSNFEKVEKQITQLKSIEKGDIVTYSSKEGKFSSVGGDAIKTIRQFEKSSNSSSLFSESVQKIAGYFQEASPELLAFTDNVKQNVETVLKGALDAAQKTDSEEVIKTIKEKVDALKLLLNSEGVKDAFDALVQSNQATQASIHAIQTNLTDASKEIDHEATIAQMLFTLDRFGKSRIDTINYNASHNGSIQAYDVLSYKEYLAILSVIQKEARDAPLSGLEKVFLNKLPEASRKNYADAYGRFSNKVKDFESKHPKIADPGIRDQIKDQVVKGLEDLRTIDSQLVKLSQALAKDGSDKDKISNEEYIQQAQPLLDRKLEITTQLNENVNMIADAKNLMRKLVSEEGEGSWLDVFSFVDDPNLSYFKDIEAISAVQHSAVDEVVNAQIWAEHLSNQPKISDEYVKTLNAVVVGAGPNGLLAAISLLLAGAKVTLVNDRGERYIRNQIVDLDPKWAMSLRYLLGTKFDELFIGENALGRYVEKGHYISVNTKNLEDALKERATELAAYFASKEQKPSFNVLYEAPFREAVHPANSSSYVAVLDTPARASPDSRRLNQSLIDSRTAKIIDRDFKKQDLNEKIEIDGQEKTILEIAQAKARQELIEEKSDEIMKFLEDKYPEAYFIKEKQALVDGKPVLIYNGKAQSPREYAELELKGEAPQLRTPPRVEFNFLVCCGGVRDTIRDVYLDVPREETIPKGYGVAVLTKGDKFKEYSFIKGPTGRLFRSMEDLQPHLQKQKFEEVLQAKVKGDTGQETDEFLLPEGMRKKYDNLTEMLVRGIEIKVPESKDDSELAVPVAYQVDSTGKFILKPEPAVDKNEVQLRVFENKLTFYVGAETPPALSEFLNDLENLKKGASRTKIDQITALKKVIDQKWFSALSNRFIEESHPELGDIINPKRGERNLDPEKLNFDLNDLNTGTFPVTQFAVDTAAVQLQDGDASLIVTALGDSRASPHFFTGSGLSTGRLGIENAAILVRDYHKGKEMKSGLPSREGLVEQLSERLDNVKLQVLAKGSNYVKRSPEKVSNEKRAKSLCSSVNSTCEFITKAKSEGLQPEFEILKRENVSVDKPEFGIQLSDGRIFDAIISEKGNIKCKGEGDKEYSQTEYPSIRKAVSELKLSRRKTL